MFYSQRQDFSSRAGIRDFALYPKGARILPNFGYKSMITRSARETLLQPDEQSRFIEPAYRWMNDQSQASLASIIFFLDQLIVAGPAAKLGRNSIFQQLKQLAAGIIHPLTGHFLKTPDCVKVLRESNLVERTAAVPGYHGCVVPVFHVEKKSRCRRVHRSLHERVN